MQAELGSQQASANAAAARYKANREHLNQADGDWINLFPDFSVAGNKAAEDFQALAALRIGNQKQADAQRLEAEREKIRAQEQAKADALPEPLLSDLSAVATFVRDEAVATINANHVSAPPEPAPHRWIPARP